MKWSVSIHAEGDRPMELDEVVALADAVAPLNGVASGVGAMSYGAQIVVEADHADHAVDVALPLFSDAVATAGLPDWPVTKAEVIGEDEGFVAERKVLENRSIETNVVNDRAAIVRQGASRPDQRQQSCYDSGGFVVSHVSWLAARSSATRRRC